MKLKGLAVRRLHDLGAFEVDDLAPGLNLLVGPNGSGKTSVMNAARAVLWGTPKLPHADLVTVWDDGRETWRAVLVGGAAGWQRGGADVPPPEVPDAALAASWVVGLRELLTGGDTEDALLDRVRRQMAGGYDLAGLLDEYAGKRWPGRAEQKTLREKRDALRAIEGRRAELARSEDGLADLREQRLEALAARDEAERLGQALERARVAAELAAAEQRLTDFEAGVSVATADARDRLREWDEALAEARRAADAARHDLDRAAEAAGAAGIDEPVESGDLAAAREHAREVGERARDAAEARRAADAARAEAQAARRALAPDLAPDADGPAPELDAVQAWAEEVLRARAAVDEVEARLAIVVSELEGLGPVPDAAEADALGRAAALLEGASAAGAGARWPGWLLGLGGALMVAGVVLAVLATPWLLALAGLGAGLLLGPLLGGRGGGGVAAAQAAWPAGVERPAAWDPESVDAARRRVRARRDAADQARLLEDARRRLAQARDRHQAELEALAARRDDLLAGVALDPLPGDLRLADLLRRLSDWRAAAGVAAAREAEAADAGAHLDRATSDLRAALDRLGAGDVPVGEALARLDVLDDQSQALRAARRDQADARRRLDEQADRVTHLEARIQDLLHAAGLGDLGADAARARFDELAQQRPAWEAAHEEARRLAHRAGELEAALADHPGLLELDRPALEARRADAEASAGRLEPLVAEISRTEAALEDERASQAYEEALADVTAAEQQLADVREQALHDAAARLLLEDVQATHAEQQLPEVFQRARALFTRFTRGRYDLTLDGVGTGRLALRAVDTAAPGGAGLALEALSDGTRMQLLLATRVAFATGEEQGRPLPLFLDESLTATDPVRFGAVADAVLALAEDGRQVFYLTSDPADVARWQQACARRGVAAPRVVDLAQARQVEGALDPEDLVLPPAPEVPAPDGLDAAEYGRRLGVPQFDPFEGGDSVHLYFLLQDDLPLLRRLLQEAQVNRLGPLRRVLALDGTGLLADDERARVEALGRVARAFADAWQVGRGRPVDQAALEASGAVSDAFIDRVTEVAEELGGRAADLVAAFEAPGSERDERLKGFRTSALEKLEAYLREAGYLDPSPRLTEAEILARCRDAVAEALDGGVLDTADVARTVRALEAATGAR